MDAITVLTAVLVVVTAAYAYLTWIIAKKSAESSEAARVAAEASSRAADAAMKSAVIAEASMLISFFAIFDRHSDGQVWISLGVNGANVFVHRAGLETGAVMESADSKPRAVVPVELKVLRDGHLDGFPVRLNQNEVISLSWPGSPFRLSDWGAYAKVRVHFSLDGEAENRDQVVQIFKPDDYWDVLNERLGVMPDMLEVRGRSRPSSENSEGGQGQD